MRLSWPDLPLPDHLQRAAFVVLNGERLWRADQAIEVAQWLASRRLGIMGGEIYARHDVGWGTFLRDWATEPMLGIGEGWFAYVERATNQARAVITDHRREAAQGFADSDHLYFLAFSSEDAYPDEPRASAALFFPPGEALADEGPGQR
jgi:hypothetical protein